MIKHVGTNKDLLRAVAENAHEIQICNDKLAFELIVRPEKFKIILCHYGYKLCKTMYLGRFNVRLLKYSVVADSFRPATSDAA